jgi:hypothetical protein
MYMIYIFSKKTIERILYKVNNLKIKNLIILFILTIHYIFYFNIYTIYKIFNNKYYIKFYKKLYFIYFVFNFTNTI